jgi:hypothetical protein
MNNYEVEFWEKVYIAAIRADKATDTAARIANEAVRQRQLSCK